MALEGDVRVLNKVPERIYVRELEDRDPKYNWRFCEWQVKVMEEFVKNFSRSPTHEEVHVLYNKLGVVGAGGAPLSRNMVALWFQFGDSDEDSSYSGGSSASESESGISEFDERLNVFLKDLQSMLRKMQDQYHDNFRPAEVVAKSSYFIDYVQKTRLLQNLEPHTLSDTGKRVLFVNVYNSLVVHGVCDAWPHLPEFHEFRKNTAYLVGAHTFTLDIIEHAILRSNSPHAYTNEELLDDIDQRRPLAVSKKDPRVLFILNRAASLLRPFVLYTPQTIEEGMVQATHQFCNSETEINGNEIKLSGIFKVYQKDFGENEKEVLDFIANHLPDEKKAQLEEVLENPDHSLVYKDDDAVLAPQ